ncbi:hypothetical protein IFM89_028145 [Coptis chinensis]|uniref:Uncharacterized protein n=1 Tax=Coptis chinensis TaxID=261450 RepID=A0A835HXT9_9MAGN|nr:hypothetical protein IFM89_028145 [Coptis chinensis]
MGRRRGLMGLEQQTFTIFVLPYKTQLNKQNKVFHSSSSSSRHVYRILQKPSAMTVKLFANKEHMGFSNVNDFPPSDTVVLSPDNLKVIVSL